MKADDEADNEEMTDKHLMPPPSTVPKNKRSTRRSKFKNMSDEDEDSSDDSEEEVDNVPVVRCKRRERVKENTRASFDNSNASPSAKRTRSNKPVTPRKPSARLRK